MAILLSHTSAIEALRRLGALPEVRAGDGSAYPAVSMTPGAGDALLAWRKAFGSDPALPIHVQLPAGSRRVRSRGLVTHPLRDLPAGAIFKISNGLLCLTPAALCLQMAPRLTRLELLVLVQELMGTYAIRPDVARGMATREAPHLAPDDLRDFLSRNGGMRGADKAAWVLERAVPHAASPRESKLVIRLSLKPAMGGYGLPVRGLNQEVTVAGLVSHGETVRRPDVILSNPEAGEGGPLVALEYDGADHQDEGRHAQDVRRTNELVSAGLSEYVIDKGLYGNLAYMDGLAERVRRDLCLPRQHLSQKQCEQRESRRRELFEELEVIDGVTWGGLARERARREGQPLRIDDSQASGDDLVPIEAYGV